MLTSVQISLARSALKWSASDLDKLANVEFRRFKELSRHQPLLNLYPHYGDDTTSVGVLRD